MSLKALREDLRDRLGGAGFHAFTTVPETITPPVVFVSPNEPYLVYEGGLGLSFGEALARHRLVVVVEPGANDVQADALDDLIDQLLRVDLGPHQLESVDEPGRITLNGQPHLGVAINLSTTYNPLEEQ